MDFFWMFLAVVIAACVLMNLMGTTIIAASHIHDDSRKRVLMLILWGLPMLGVFVIIRMINKDIKKNQAKMEEEIAPAIREVADRLKVLDADLSSSRAKNISDESLNQNTKIH
jgi:type VI protein secretion system component VasK